MNPVVVTLEQDVQIPVGGSSVTVPAKTILGDLLARLQPQAVRTAVPRIGEAWPGQGGIYAGTVRGETGEPDYHLIVLADAAATDIGWQASMDWAAGLQYHGFTDYTLPSRREQSVLFANTRELFEERYYWSKEQYAGTPDCAWSTHFGNGFQYNDRKSYGARARAVRRVLIIQ